MTCARRLAGARRPAPSTSADSPRRPEPRPGRSRARLPLLPALALLLGALGLFVAAPAQAQAPAAPTNLSVEPRDARLALAWTVPSGTVTGYDVHYTSAPATGSNAVANSATASGSSPATAWVAESHFGTSRFWEISGLSNGTAYRVRVRAKNSSGSSAWVFGMGTPELFLRWSSATNSTAEGDTAGLQLRITPAGAAASVAVSGTLTYAAGSNNPASLADDLTSGYATTFSVAAGSIPTPSLAVPVNDTVNEEHETYTITINAGTGYTVGTPSTLTVTIIDNDPPAAPSGLSLTAGNGQLTASWSKPVGPVTGYQLRYKVTTATDQTASTPNDPSTGWVTSTPSGTGTSADITGLTNATAYHVQVRATDGQTQTGNGYGDWSASQTGTPAVPAPTNLSVSAGNASMTVTWTAPSGTVASYDVHYTSAVVGTVGNDATASGSDPSAAWVDASHSGTVTAQTISGLTNDTPYRVRVRAVNVGGGAWAFGTGTPREAPTVSLEASETVSEGDYPVRIIAELSEPAASAVQVRFKLTLNTAELVDFAAGSGVVFDSGATPVTGARTLTIPAGEYNAEFDLYTEHDDDGEDEMFTVAIDTSNLPAGYIAGSPVSVTVTIDDDESRNTDPALLTGLTVHDGTQDLYLDANRADGLAGLGGPDAIYTVQVNPGIRSVDVTLTWTNASITEVNGAVRYMTYGENGSPLTWSSSGAEMSLRLMVPNLSAEGTTELTLTLTGVESEPYVILFQHNFDWGSANDRLGKILMRSSQ